MGSKNVSVDWIFFDLGSTLTDESGFERYMLDYIYEMLKKRVRDLSREAFDEALRTVIEERRQGTGGYRSLVVELVLCLTKDSSLFRQILDAFDSSISTKYNQMLGLYPESITVLEKLKGRFHLGLIANQPAEARQRLAYLGLTRYLKVIVLSAEVGFSKPDPRIFLHALKLADCQPQRAIMVGDRLDNDVAPAKEIGMKTARLKRGLLIRQKPMNEIEVPDREMSNLDGLLAVE